MAQWDANTKDHTCVLNTIKNMHNSITNPEDNTKEVNCVYSRIHSLTQISHCKTSNENDSKGVTYKIKTMDFK
jgi:hypothetical protein